MIFLHRARLVILSQTKTGSTALVNALRDRASISIKGPAPLKHINYETFMETFAPWLQRQAGMARSDYDVVAIMREPIDWLGSWYRYRTRRGTRRDKSARFTGNVYFDDFVREVCKDKKQRATFAKISGPEAVSRSGDLIGVDKLFPYEDLSGLYELIETRTNEAVVTERRNVSPERPLELSDATEKLVRGRMSFAFDLHSSLQPSGEIPARFRAP